jgi:hypothetical protein
MEEHKGTIESRALTAAALVRCHIKPASLIHQKSGETPGAGLMGDPFSFLTPFCSPHQNSSNVWKETSKKP